MQKKISSANDVDIILFFKKQIINKNNAFANLNNN